VFPKLFRTAPLLSSERKGTQFGVLMPHCVLTSPGKAQRTARGVTPQSALTRARSETEGRSRSATFVLSARLPAQTRSISVCAGRLLELVGMTFRPRRNTAVSASSCDRDRPLARVYPFSLAAPAGNNEVRPVSDRTGYLPRSQAKDHPERSGMMVPSHLTGRHA